MKRFNRFGMCAAVAAFAAASIIGCGSKSDQTTTGSSAPSSPSATSSDQGLTGAGSTFVNPVMTQWTADYLKSTGTAVNYQSIGSGGGITGLIGHTVDFAGSDAPMNAQEMAAAKTPVIHLPVVIGTECIAYNVPGVPAGIHLTGPLLAQIYLGKITHWDDPQLVALNPTVKFPHATIFVAHRSDGSGTTFIFTDYLSKISPDWKTTVGNGKSVKWPIGLGGKGNEGVSGLLQTHSNSIGYVELAYAVQNKMTYAVIQNAKGKFVSPSSQSGSIAADGVTIPADMRVSITNTPNPLGYPITGVSWLIVYQTSPKSAELKKFLTYVVTTGQDATTPLSYAPVPKPIQKRELKLINTLQ